jgi:purine catabolism regulator
VRKELDVALDDLRSLIDIALRAGRSGSVTLDEFLPELLLEGSPHLADRVEERVFSALREHGELMKTLEVLVGQDFDRGATAMALPVHRNTLAYRLRRIEELTGLKLDHAGDRALAWLAVLRRTAVRDDE